MAAMLIAQGFVGRRDDLVEGGLRIASYGSG
jgi:hypothetical protein